VQGGHYLLWLGIERRCLFARFSQCAAYFREFRLETRRSACRVVEKTLAGVVFDSSADARQARGADGERASFEPVRLAKNSVFRVIVEGVLKLEEACWNVRDEQFNDFGDDVGAERLKLGQDNIVQNREGRLGCMHGTSLSNRCAAQAWRRSWKSWEISPSGSAEYAHVCAVCGFATRCCIRRTTFPGTCPFVSGLCANGSASSEVCRSFPARPVARARRPGRGEVISPITR